MKSIKQLMSDVSAKSNAYRRFKTARIRMVGEIAVADCKKNFDNQRFGNGQKWTDRTKATNAAYDRRGDKKGSVYKSTSPILLQTGNLRDGIKWRGFGKKIFIGVNLSQFPGAELLNEGGTGSAWGKHSFRMPKRQFLGWTPRMRDSIKKKIKFEHDKIFSNWKR